MDAKNLIQLRIEKKNDGYSLYLDDKEIRHVEHYEIKEAEMPGAANVTIKLLAQYP